MASATIRVDPFAFQQSPLEPQVLPGLLGLGVGSGGAVGTLGSPSSCSRTALILMFFAFTINSADSLMKTSTVRAYT